MKLIKRYSIFFETLFLIFFGIGLIYVAPQDPDFGWHYKYGEYTFNNLSVLKDNIYSYNYPDYKWANSYWISQLLMYLISANLGYEFVGLIFATLFVLAFLFLFKGYDFYTKVVCLLILGMSLSLSYASVRPFLFSSIFMLMLIFVLIFKNQFIKLLPLLFLVWANFHADFVLGLATFACFIFFKFIEEKKISAFLIGIFLASLFLTLLNPFGFNLWITLFNESNPVQFNFIGEWLPGTEPDFYGQFYLALKGVLFGLCVICGVKNKPWYTFMVVFFFLLSFRSVYFARLFFIFAVFTIPLVSKFISDFYNSYFKLKYLPYIFNFLIFLLLLVSFYKFVYNFEYALDLNKLFIKGGYPIGALNYIKQNNLKGPIYNNYDWGGFLIWQHPTEKTFIDGRMPAWHIGDNYLFNDTMKFYAASKNGFKHFEPHLNNVNLVIERSGSDPEYYFSGLNKRWKKVYKDDTAVVFVRVK